MRAARREGEVDERILVAGPPVRQLLGAGIHLEAKAAGLRRHRSRRIFQLRRHHRHVGRCGEPLAGTIRWQPELRVPRPRRARRARSSLLPSPRARGRRGESGSHGAPREVRSRTPSSRARSRPGASSRRDHRGRAARRERRARRSSPDHHPVCAVHVQLGEPAHQRHPLIAGGLVDRREREAETLDVAPELTLSRDENVVPGPKARLRERSQRPDVTRAPAGCEEDAHAGRKERTTGLEPATPSLGSEGCAARPSGVWPRCSPDVAIPRACYRDGAAAHRALR